jgi:phage terminase large subunit
VRSTKGKNSIHDGVEFIKSYDVVIHTRCRMVAKEFLHYSYKVDPKTEEVISELVDIDNHTIDAIRYGLELVRKSKKSVGRIASIGPSVIE